MSESKIFPAWPDLYLARTNRTLPPLSLSTSADSLQEIEPGEDFTMYVCGITPYDATHLGHAATYLTFDLINRYLTLSGTSVSFVENITDIDEPLLERATRDGIDWKYLAESQIDLFREDMAALHILPPKFYVPATAVMHEIDLAITRMQERGYVYNLDGDLYFEISAFLPELPISLDSALTIFSERGGDPNRPGKHHPLDPVLWWANKKDEPGWESSHGFGRPGWHIECSVIALRYLIGENYLSTAKVDFAIDLQGGGSDLIFPHHFMSAAQACALLGAPFSRYFVHAGMVGLDGEKMSKSKGNLVFVSSLRKAGRDPMAIRHALLSTHYQRDRMWSEEILVESERQIALIRSALAREEVASTDRLIVEMIAALSNNLDTPKALDLLVEWASQSDLEPSQIGTGELSRLLDSLLGLAL